MISNVFSSVGYAYWKCSIIISLSVKNKVGFADGSIIAPLISSESYSTWFRSNSLVICWALNSLSKNITSSVLFLSTCNEIWKELRLIQTTRQCIDLSYPTPTLFSFTRSRRFLNLLHQINMNLGWITPCSTHSTLFICSVGFNQQILGRSTIISITDATWWLIQGCSWSNSHDEAFAINYFCFLYHSPTLSLWMIIPRIIVHRNALWHATLQEN